MVMTIDAEGRSGTMMARHGSSRRSCTAYATRSDRQQDLASTRNDEDRTQPSLVAKLQRQPGPYPWFARTCAWVASATVRKTCGTRPILTVVTAW